MSYFGLTFAQIEDFKKSYGVLRAGWETTVLSTVTSLYPYNNTQGVAYWQWAASELTINNGDISVTKVVETVTGYPEINYFIKNNFTETIKGTPNEAIFDGVKLFVSQQNDTENYEHLFNLTEGYLEMSLFNITTL